MKVLQLSKFYPPVEGGIEIVTYDITEVLNAEGIKCDVLCANTENKYVEDKIKNYTVYRTKNLGILFSTSMTPQIIFKLKEIMNNYTVIHVHLPDPMTNLALFLTNPKKQKIVVHWHSDIIKQKYILKLYEPLLNWLLRRADKIVATSPKYIEESTQLRKYKNKCIAIPLGIDEKRLGVDHELVQQIKDRYPNKKIIFSLGRLVYYKGFEYLIKAGNFLNDDYVILIGGSGKLKNELETMIKTENLQEKVFLLGYIEDEKLGSYYSACDIFCLTSVEKSEAFGVVQIEGMSFRKPIIASKIKGSGVDWVNEDHVSGINVPVKDSQAIAEACEEIMLNDEVYARYSENAYKRFLSYFLRETMANKKIEVYKQLLEKV